MAEPPQFYYTTTSSSTATYPAYTPLVFTSPGISFNNPGPLLSPRPQTALEWLNAEVERTCALARTQS